MRGTIVKDTVTLRVDHQTGIVGICTQAGAYEPPKEHETCTTCRVPSQSKFITKYCPYKESEILLFEAVYGLRVTTKQWRRIS